MVTSQSASRYNLLSFLAVDSDPPVNQNEFYAAWEWFTRPLLTAYARNRLNFDDPTATLPPIFLGELFATFKLDNRKLLDRLSENLPTRDEEVGNAKNYLRRVDAEISRCLDETTRRTFGAAEWISSDGASNANAKWVQNLTTLVDPLSFPLESVVYGKQQTVANAVEIIEQNTAGLEAYRRTQLKRNAELWDEVNRLSSTLYAMRKIARNLDRVLDTVKTWP